jgi:hypothetical protein
MPIHHTSDHPDSFGITYTGKACAEDRHEDCLAWWGRGHAGPGVPVLATSPRHHHRPPPPPTKATTSSCSSPSGARPTTTRTAPEDTCPPTGAPVPATSPTSSRADRQLTRPVSSSAACHPGPGPTSPRACRHVTPVQGQRHPGHAGTSPRSRANVTLPGRSVAEPQRRGCGGARLGGDGGTDRGNEAADHTAAPRVLETRVRAFRPIPPPNQALWQRHPPSSEAHSRPPARRTRVGNFSCRQRSGERTGSERARPVLGRASVRIDIVESPVLVKWIQEGRA